jgi:WD40 repeat protein
MAWVQDPVDGSHRLFTGGMDGTLTEWDLNSRRAKHVGDSYGGAVWAIAAEPPGQLKEGALNPTSALTVAAWYRHPACRARLWDLVRMLS